MDGICSLEFKLCMHLGCGVVAVKDVRVDLKCMHCITVSCWQRPLYQRGGPRRMY